MDYQAKLNEEMAQRNQQRQNEYFGMTAEYNSAKNQKQRLEEAGLNPALMYGSAGSGGAGTGSTGGASGSGVGLSQAQAVGMGLQLSQIKAQTNMPSATSTNYLHNKWMQFLLEGAAFTPPASLWLGLFTTVPGLAGTGGVEVSTSGTAYGRKEIVSTGASWSGPSGTNQEYSNAATGGLASGVGSFVSGLFGGGGLDYHDQKKLMEKQHGYELENMDYQAKLNEEMAQRNQERQNEYFGMTAEYNSAKNQKQRLEEAGLNPALMYGTAGQGGQSSAGQTGPVGLSDSKGTAIQQQQMAMGLQLAQIASQIKVNDSVAEKNKAEAEKTAGADTEAAKAQAKLNERLTSLQDTIEKVMNSRAAQRSKLFQSTSRRKTSVGRSTRISQKQLNRRCYKRRSNSKSRYRKLEQNRRRL